MPITVEWDNPQHTIIRYTFREDWSWDDFHSILDESAALWESVSHRVDVIVDVADTDLPFGDGLPHLKRLQQEYRKVQAGNTVIVGVKGTYRVMANAFVKLYNQMVARGKVFFADTLDDARQILRGNRNNSSE